MDDPTPLSETELSELFAADPATMSDVQFEQLIAHMRADRARFQQAEATGKRAPKSAKPTEPVSLKDLGL